MLTLCYLQVSLFYFFVSAFYEFTPLNLVVCRLEHYDISKLVITKLLQTWLQIHLQHTHSCMSTFSTPTVMLLGLQKWA